MKVTHGLSRPSTALAALIVFAGVSPACSFSPPGAGASADAGEPAIEPLLAPGDVRLVSQGAGKPVLDLFRRDAADGAWTPQGVTAEVGGDAEFIVAAVAPGGLEVVAAQVRAGDAASQLVVQDLGTDGFAVAWRAEIELPANVRGFDLALERSGDALAVYATGTGGPQFRARTGGSWSQPAPAPVEPAGNALWIRLAQHPDTDEISLIVIDDQEELWLARWDGEAWDPTGVHLLSSIVKRNTITGIVNNPTAALAYEASGALMVIWGSENERGFRWSRVPPGMAPSVPALVNNTPADDISMASLAARPGTNEMAAVVGDLGVMTEEIGAAFWDGFTWSVAAEPDSDSRDINDMAQGDFTTAVGWLGDRAFGIYPDDEVGTIDGVEFDRVTWRRAEDVTIAKGFTESVAIAALPDGAGLVAALSDSNRALYVAEHAGAAWLPANAGEPLATSLTTDAGMPFAVAARAQ